MLHCTCQGHAELMCAEASSRIGGEPCIHLSAAMLSGVCSPYPLIWVCSSLLGYAAAGTETIEHTSQQQLPMLSLLRMRAKLLVTSPL